VKTRDWVDPGGKRKPAEAMKTHAKGPYSWGEASRGRRAFYQKGGGGGISGSGGAPAEFKKADNCANRGEADRDLDERDRPGVWTTPPGDSQTTSDTSPPRGGGGGPGGGGGGGAGGGGGVGGGGCVSKGGVRGGRVPDKGEVGGFGGGE